ncbi:MAG: hypothetical protein K2K34_06075 [Oscillospiraceae bacterium]|nr:hypothetical protein [Oscillospiraceae bacterium]
MKRKEIRRLAAVICTFAAAAMMAGCSPNSEDGGEISSQVSADAEDTSDGNAAVTEIGDGLLEDEDAITATRPIAEGDEYAIDKINPKSPEGSIPGGYKMSGYEKESQGKLFANGKSKIVIRAYNYKEDLQELSVWADQACAITKIANFTAACDTIYGEPENITYMGFDTVKYEYEVIQYEFVSGADGQEEKSERGRYKGIAYYFYSNQDAYAIMFDTAEANWEEQSAAFYDFIADLEITETTY